MKYNCIIIGSGPAGLYSALSCAKAGYKTAIIEKDQLGGTGFRTGCLPVKRNLDVLRKTEEAINLSAHEIKKSSAFSKNLLQNTELYMSEAEDLIEDRLKNANIDTFRGSGKFLDANTFLVNDKKLETDYFIIATGTTPASPPGIIMDGESVISHIEALKLKKLPKNMIIIGGNVEGIEMASLFVSLGVQITVIEMLDLILDGTDRDLAAPVIKNLTSQGVLFLTSVKAKAVEVNKLQTTVILENGKKVATEKVLVTGIRQMNIPEGIKNIKVIFSKDGIPVNNRLQTNIPNIFAAGDINGVHGMAHIAIQQGMLITKGINGNQAVKDYSSLPRAMFTLPEIAGAGKQEWELLKKGIPYIVKKIQLNQTWKGFSRNINTGFIKLIFEDNILTGIWMTGPEASEILSSSGLLIGQKLDKEAIMDNLFIHPTLGEGILEALFTA